MATFHQCDRCGHVVRPDTAGQPTHTVALFAPAGAVGVPSSWDLCPPCVADVHRVLETKPADG